MPSKKDSKDSAVYIASSVRIRRSVILLTFRLVMIIVLFSLIGLFLRLPILYFDLSSSTVATIYNINTSIIVLLVVIEMCFVLAITLGWVSEYYEILPGKITHRKGILFNRESIYLCKYVQSIKLRQGFFGKVFNYGSLELYSPALENKVYLNNIHNPKKYADIIQKIVNVNGTQDQKKNVFFNT